MPYALWRQAAALARAEGVYATARVLGLKSESLKWRVASGGSRLNARPASSATFVQLEPVPSFSTPQSDGTVVEVSDGRGGQLTMRLPPTVAVDVVGLAVAFAGHGA